MTISFKAIIADSKAAVAEIDNLKAQPGFPPSQIIPANVPTVFLIAPSICKRPPLRTYAIQHLHQLRLLHTASTDRRKNTCVAFTKIVTNKLRATALTSFFSSTCFFSPTAITGNMAVRPWLPLPAQLITGRGILTFLHSRRWQ